MGKVAKAFGVGVKGALCVLLERDAFDAGEVVQGVVMLRVAKPIECRGQQARSLIDGHSHLRDRR